MIIAGFDIGGANTDLALIEYDEKNNKRIIRTDFQYLPMWSDKEELTKVLSTLLGPDKYKVDAIGISMTAELVDAYETKKAGVLDILEKVESMFHVPLGFVSVEGMLKADEVKKNPLKVAAANWIATAPLAAELSPECILIDTGSTTTDIIPLHQGMECARGRTDMERLKTGELVYTGVLRTNIATLVDKVPLDDSWIRVASEFFAQTADVHLVLGNIGKKEYNCPTPDGMGKSRRECLRRISRIICADLDMLNMRDVEKIAGYVYEQQIGRVAEALQEVVEREKIEETITTGLGMDIIGKKASELLNISTKSMMELFNKDECVVAPAIGTAYLMRDVLD